EVVGAAMSGTLHSEDGKLKIAKYRSALDSAVSARLMPQERSDQLFDEKLSQAQGEMAARGGVEVFRQSGGNQAAAEEYLRKNILENETLTMSPAGRRRAFEAGRQAINREQTIDKADRAEITGMGRDILARVKSGQVYDETELKDAAAAALRVGSTALHRQLL